MRFRWLLPALLLGMPLLCASAPASAAAAESPRPSARQILVLLRLPPTHFRPGQDYNGAYGDERGQSARSRIAKRIARDHGLTLVDDWPMPVLGLDCFIMSVPDGQTVETAATQVARDPAVSMAQPMHLFHTEASTAPARPDPLLPAQPAARQWNLTDLHRIATGRGVSVAVIDSRIERSHPDLAGQVVIDADFTTGHPAGPERHGTGVAGIIAARADNGIGIAGIAPGARLMGLRACWQVQGGSVCDSLSLAKALHFAIEHGARVVNMSLSGPDDPLLGRLLDVAQARGAALVAAYDRALPGGGFPASHQGVLAIAENDLAALPPEVYTAPGRDVPTTQPGGRWSLVSGSSYAAAHVSGLLALARERRPAGGKLLLASARPHGGTVNACATLLGAAASCDCACPRAAGATMRDRARPAS